MILLHKMKHAQIYILYECLRFQMIKRITTYISSLLETKLDYTLKDNDGRTVYPKAS